MTQTLVDGFSKQLFEEFLAPFGEVRVSLEVPGESNRVDVYFILTTPTIVVPKYLGFLEQISITPALIE
jgi:hypothetical protein